MRAFNVTIGENGRMIIPAIFRKQLDIKPGDEVIMSISADNDIIVHSPKQSLHKLQKLFKKGNESFVDSLLEMRKKEKI